MVILADMLLTICFFFVVCVAILCASGVKVHEWYHNINGSEVTGQSPFQIWLNEAVTGKRSGTAIRMWSMNGITTSTAVR